MIRKFAGVAVAAAFGVGCSSVLGYDDLSFQEADGSAGGGLGGGGTGGTPGSGATGFGGGAGTTTGGFGGADAAVDGAGTGAASGGGTTATGGTGGATGTGGAPPVTCNPACGHGFYCDPASQTCKCHYGFVLNGTKCDPVLPGDPATHTEAEVCAQWKGGNAITDPSPWKAGPTECDPGITSQGGINDAVARINMYRWLVGLGPAVDDPARNETNRWCAAVVSWNPPGTVPNPHSPPPSAKCYTQKGASGAGSSNISWGVGVAQAITQFIVDNGNFTTFGHRRWILSAGMGITGIGHYAGGGKYGRATCQYSFGGGTTYPAPDWVSLPPPGFVPTTVVNYVWTFHHKSSVSAATMKVTNTATSANLPMKTLKLTGGYGSYSTIAFQRDGWTAKSGEVYDVTVDGISGGPISYQVKAVTCN